MSKNNASAALLHVKLMENFDFKISTLEKINMISGKQLLPVSVILFALLSACSSSPKIISSSEDQVVLKADPADFVEAYNKAVAECQKYARPAQYIRDYSEDINMVAFTCVAPEVEETVIEEASEETIAEESEELPVEDENATEPDTESENSSQ